MNGTWQHVKNIVVARLDNIGDVLLLSPALRALKEHLPGVKLTLFASPAGSSAAALLPEVDDLLTWRVVWQDVGYRMAFDPQREQELVKALGARSFDAAIIFTSFSQTPYGVAYACYLAGIPIRLGQSKEFGGSLLSTAVPVPPDALHQAVRNLHLVESAGFTAVGRDLRLHVAEDAAASAAAKLAEHGLPQGHPYVLLHAGASCPARAYPASRYAEVADAVVDRFGLPVVLSGAERERSTMQAVCDGMRAQPHVLVGATTVEEWAALIQGARLMLANDSGAMHLADACRTPNVILFSGTDLKEQWAPRHSPTRVLQRPVPCSPCYGFVCPYHLECLDVPPAEVVDTIGELLAVTAEAAQERAMGA